MRRLPCGCNRASAHLHYSNNHEFFVKWGLIFFLLAEGVAFVAGYVQASTTVLLPNYKISAYEAVLRTTAKLVAPYEYLRWIVGFEELAALILGIAAVATLHSIKHRTTHLIAIVGVIVLFGVHFVTVTYYDNATQQALGQLPNLVNADTLKTAQEVEEALYRECGFWCSPASDMFNIVFSLAYAGLFVAASLTARVVTVWQPTPTLLVTTMGQPEIPQVTTETPRERSYCESCGSEMSAQSVICPNCGHRNVFELLAQQEKLTKFCRHCGAKIPRVSKYCEECGKRLA